MKKLSSVICLLVVALSLDAQTITYKASKWGNTKLHKSWTTALDNPILEKVIITQTDKAFEIAFGGKRSLAYIIISSQKLSPTSVKYSVKSNNQSYFITVSIIDNSYYIFCENEWVVADITEMSSSK